VENAMKNYIDSKIPKSISRFILEAILGTILFFVVKSLFGVPSMAADLVGYALFLLVVGAAIYRKFFKKSKK
jgi:hypothetical protein